MADEEKVLETKSRRNPTKRVAEVPKSLSDLKSWVCRTCLKRRPLKEFYLTTDPNWDTNGHMPTCRFCIDDAFEKISLAEQSIDKAIYLLCRDMNVKYDNKALESTKKTIATMEEKGKLIKGIFGIYKKSLLTGGYGGFRSDGDLTFEYSNNLDMDDPIRDESISEEDYEYLEQSWGKKFSIEDYNFLEESFAKWTRTTKCDTYGEEILIRELCHKENEIRKARLENRPVDNLVKSLQDIMKNSAVTPALQNAASSGRYAEAFGNWIRDIEALTPAEWYKDQEKYRDIEGIGEYNDRYITRSIKNFITGSRDFSMEDTLDIAGDEGDME